MPNIEDLLVKRAVFQTVKEDCFKKMNSLIKTIVGKDIPEAANWLKQGACVGIPTETVYGLAANALDPTAVVQIFSIKNRPTFDPLIVHVDKLESAEDYVESFPFALRALAERFWPGPLTLLLPKKEIIPDLVTAGLPRVAVRVPQHTLVLELLRQLPFPLAAPSANPFGYISPTRAEHVEQQLGGLIPYILDGGACGVGLESTIVGLEGNLVTVYRLGGLSIEAIESVVGPVQIQLNQSSNPAAPGMLKSHYAPRKPLFLGDVKELISEHPGKRIGLLSFSGVNDVEVFQQEILTKTGNMEEAAKHLFAALRALDNSEAELLVGEWVPDQGLGRAINDRLRRAAVVGKE